jgi:hypothetical protein
MLGPEVRKRRLCLIEPLDEIGLCDASYHLPFGNAVPDGHGDVDDAASC